MDNPNNENWREILSRMEDKINQIDKRVEKINRQVNPPWWKILAGFVANNFFTILTLISLFFIAWKAWGFYQNLNDQFEIVKNIPTNTMDSIKGLPQGASESIMEMIKGIKF